MAWCLQAIRWLSRVFAISAFEGSCSFAGCCYRVTRHGSASVEMSGRLCHSLPVRLSAWVLWVHSTGLTNGGGDRWSTGIAAGGGALYITLHLCWVTAQNPVLIRGHNADVINKSIVSSQKEGGGGAKLSLERKLREGRGFNNCTAHYAGKGRGGNQQSCASLWLNTSTWAHKRLRNTCGGKQSTI